MGDGSLHAKGLRLCVTNGDDDVVERLVDLGPRAVRPRCAPAACEGYTEVSLHSVPLTIWWEACGFAKLSPSVGHTGKGWTAHIPDAVLHSNDREVYGGFLRGLFEADGNANHGYAYWWTTCEEFSRDVQTLMLALGFVTTRGMDGARVKWGAPCHRIRLLNAATGMRFAARSGSCRRARTRRCSTGSTRRPRATTTSRSRASWSTSSRRRTTHCARRC